MALLWVTPRDWGIKEPITSDKLNEISKTLNYLAKPSQGLVSVRGTGADVAVTSTTPVDLDLATYQISVELTGQLDVTVDLVGVVANTTLNTRTRFDVFIDNSLYASSLTGTPLTEGLAVVHQYVAAYNLPVVARVRIPYSVLGVGVHTFQPRMWVTAGSSSWRMAAGWFSQFVVREG